MMSTETFSSSNTESRSAMPSPVDVVPTSNGHSIASSLPVFSPLSLSPEVISAVRALGHLTIGEDGISVDSRLVVSVSLFFLIYMLM